MSDDGGRQIIDEKGRVFGLINVIDVLVIILVLAMVIGGIAVVMALGTASSETGETETKHLTVDLGEQPLSVAERIQSGETWTLQDNSELTITDVFRSGHVNESATVVVRARADVRSASQGIELGNEQVRIGTKLDLRSATSQASGTVTAIDEEGETLAIEDRTVTVETTVSTAVANAIDVGDEYRIGGETVATIEAVESSPAEAGNRQHVTAEIRVVALEQGETRHFANKPLRIGATVPFKTNDYQFTGEIVALQ